MLIPSKFEGYLCGRRLYPGDKGGSSAPPPDPRLVQAQIDSMGTQDDVMKMLMQTAQDQAPIQKEQQALGLSAAKDAYAHSNDQYAYMKGKQDLLSPIQDKIAAESTNFDEGARAKVLQDQSSANISKSFDNVADQQQRALDRRSVNPNSGAALAMGESAAISKAVANAGASSAATQQAHTEGLSLQDRANNTLSGYPAMTSGQNNSGAALGASGLSIANAGLQGLDAGLTSVSGVAGAMGANATGMYGVQANAYAQSQMADAQASAGLGNAIGGIAMAL